MVLLHGIEEFVVVKNNILDYVLLEISVTYSFLKVKWLMTDKIPIQKDPPRKARS